MTNPESEARVWNSTLRVQAEVLLAGGRVLTGFLHLQPLSSAHSGPETPEDLLNRHDAFFPLTGEDQRTLFVSKDQVMAVGIAAGAVLEDPDRVIASRSLSLRVELSDGTEFAGIVNLEQPPTRSRSLDFFNEPLSFFALHAPEAVRFINRRQVRVVNPFD
jgi:hypothetical protein